MITLDSKPAPKPANTTDALAQSNAGATRKTFFVPSGVCEGRDNAVEAEEEAARRKKDPASGSDGKSDASGTGGRLPPGSGRALSVQPGHIFMDIGGEDGG